MRRSSKQKRQSQYSIEFGTPGVDAVRSGTLNQNRNRDDSLSPKPMTPRSEYESHLVDLIIQM